jgi:hypothetical protein
MGLSTASKKATRILLVHGMGMEKKDEKKTHDRWVQAILDCLGRTKWGQSKPVGFPDEDEIDLVFWADLFRPEDKRKIAKGLTGAIRRQYDAFLRKAVVSIDKRARFATSGKPEGIWARFVNSWVTQAVFYMQNSRLLKSPGGGPGGAYDHIQKRLRDKLLPVGEAGPKIVIGHSLGSVIAYEGLCHNKTGVDTFITIGSPLATPYLIVEPLRQRFCDLIGRPPTKPLPFPNVQRWLNFHRRSDVFPVPVPKLTPLFDKGVRLHEFTVPSGTDLKPHNIHKITAYLEADNQIGDYIASAL